MSKWRTIDSAPKGETVIGWGPKPHCGWIDIIHHYDGWGWIGSGEEPLDPTHWMPLPDPPKE